MSTHVIRGNALHLPLADSSVDLVVTSPPYFALRSYQDSGQHYPGQLGHEATPAGFVDTLFTATIEMIRVLKPTGSLWINLGDKYATRTGQGGPQGTTGQRADRKQAATYDTATPHHYQTRPKSLIGVPWRYALRCIDELGLILRAEVIWSKPNGLPESVTDRVRRSHETWFHFTKSPKYYSAIDEIREPHNGRLSSTPQPLAERGQSIVPGNTPHRTPGPDGWGTNPLGKLPGSVWTIATQPLKVPAELGIDHFAAFPMEWPRRLIRGWSPPGICTVCGEGRRPVSHNKITGDRGGRQFNPSSGNVGVLGKERVYAITGYACACSEPTATTRPAVVLDPFGGTGTTALVAHALGRVGISVDMSADYCRLAQWRTTDPGQLDRARQGVRKPRRGRPAPTQPHLF